MTPQDFAVLMQKELDANAGKGDWSTWQPPTLELLIEIQHHLAKLRIALYEFDGPRIMEFSADLANLAMKAAELAVTQSVRTHRSERNIP